MSNTKRRHNTAAAATLLEPYKNILSHPSSSPRPVVRPDGRCITSKLHSLENPTITIPLLFSLNYGALSSIHLLGDFFVTTTLSKASSPCSAGRTGSVRLRRSLLRAGQGRTVDAETVTTAPKKVSAKREETNERRWALVTRRMRIRRGK